jgi:hypothetical protein
MTQNITISGESNMIYSRVIKVDYSSPFGVKITVVTKNIIPSISMNREEIDEYYAKNPPEIKEIEVSKEDSVKIMIALQKINF